MVSHKKTPAAMLEGPLERQSKPEKETPEQHFPDLSFRVDGVYAPYQAERVNRVPRQTTCFVPKPSNSKPYRKEIAMGRV